MSMQDVSPPAGGQGTTPPSPPVAPPPPPPDPGAPPPVTEEPKPFYADFKSPETRGYAERKAWKDPEALTESYLNLEKFHGVPADRLLKLPENIEDAEAMKPVLERIGYVPPADAASYKFEDMEGANPVQAKALSEIALKHGVPAKMAAAVMADVMALESQGRERAMEEIKEEVAVEMGQLRAEWGAKYDEKIEKGRRAIRHIGLSDEVLESIETSTGAAGILKAFADAHDKIGLGEGAFIEGQRKKNDNAMSPEAAMQEIQTLRNDKEFGARLLNKDAAAVARWTNLNRIASGG